MDTNLTPELVEEGFVRELVSKIQTMRKEAGFEVTDHIQVYQAGNDRIAELLEGHKETIAREVLADQIRTGETDGYVKEWNINSEKTTLGVKKIAGI